MSSGIITLQSSLVVSYEVKYLELKNSTQIPTQEKFRHMSMKSFACPFINALFIIGKTGNSPNVHQLVKGLRNFFVFISFILFLCRTEA
jgi:hypothetical protein